MVVSKHLIHFCYPITRVLHQHPNSPVVYNGIPPENSYHRKKISKSKKFVVEGFKKADQKKMERDDTKRHAG